MLRILRFCICIYIHMYVCMYTYVLRMYVCDVYYMSHDIYIYVRIIMIIIVHNRYATRRRLENQSRCFDSE